MERFRNWLKKQNFESKEGTDTAQIAHFARPIMPSIIRRKMPGIAVKDESGFSTGDIASNPFIVNTKKKRKND